MSTDRIVTTVANWRAELPTLTGSRVVLREPSSADVRPLADVLCAPDASRFGLDSHDTAAVQALIDRALRDRSNGTAFTYAVVSSSSQAIVGLLQVRQLDPVFEAAEWECTIAPAARGTGVFVEAMRLAVSFAFASVGAHRLETRVPLQNGRASGALRKLGAVQEGILRKSLRSGGDYIDQVLWALLREDWRDHWAPASPRVH